MLHALLHLGRHHPHCVAIAAKVLPSAKIAAERQQARDEAEMPVDLKMPAGRTLVRSGPDLPPNHAARGSEVGRIVAKLQLLLRVRARAGGGGATHEPFALAMMVPVPRPLVSY